METLFTLIGIFVLGLILIAVHLYAQKNEASDKPQPLRPERDFERRSAERRSGDAVTFPLILNSETIYSDRRVQPDRRALLSA